MIRAIASLVAATLLLAGAAPAADVAPNILLIVSEDNGPELGTYGDPYVRTPVLDRLAAEGTRFDRAYVPQAGCSQSRAAFLTGLYPHQNGQIGLATWKFGMYRKDTPNLVGLLKAAGYRTGIVGKLHVNPEAAFPFDFEAVAGSNFARKDLKRYAVEAERFISGSADPFFLQVNYPDAHRPFIRSKEGLPAEPLDGEDVAVLPYVGLDDPGLKQQVADYYNSLMRLDSLVGDLLGVLKATGKYDDTLIVYIGDHGADLIRGKRTCYEGGVRIPFIVKLPGGKPGQARRELVSTLDLLPTALEVAGVPAPGDLPGRSLVEMLRGGSPEWRAHLFTEYHLHSAHNYYPQRSVRDDRYKLIRNLQPGALDPGYAFTVRRFFEVGAIDEALERAPEHVRDAYRILERPPELLLFDLETDPHEFRDLAGDPDHAGILAELKGELERWRHETRDPLLDPGNVRRLREEVESIREGDDFDKRKIHRWEYPDYFFAEERRRPNILFLASDDLRCTLGCNGDGIAVTPSLDDLAASGMVFERAYCQQAVCNPSRASILTGLRPDSLKIWNLTEFYRDTRLDAPTLPELLKSHGYHTEQIGKIHHGSKKPSVDPKSWSVPQVMHHSAKRDQYHLEKNRKGGKAAAAERAVAADDDHVDGRVAAAGVAAIERLKDAGRPFFLAVGFRKPHLPFSAPERYWDLYDRARFRLPPDSPPRFVPDVALHNWKELRGYTDISREGPVGDAKRRELWHGYYAATSFMDRQVGRLLEALDEGGLREDTIVVFWSDHGVHLSEHSLWAKTSNFELDARVPLIVRFPGRGAPGQRSRALVELVDLYPTLAEACGLNPPQRLEGTSFLPLLEDPSRAWKKAVFTQHPRPAYYRGRPEVMGYSMRTDRYRYTQWRRFGSDVVVAEELYDHREDPAERVNVASDRPAEVKRLRGLMATGWRGAVPDSARLRGPQGLRAGAGSNPVRGPARRQTQS